MLGRHKHRIIFFQVGVIHYYKTDCNVHERLTYIHPLKLFSYFPLPRRSIV